MSSAERQLSMIRLFSVDKPIWTVEEAAPILGVSVSTCYRYINSLCNAGLLDPVAGKGYMLGPAFIEYDRLIRVTDPLLMAARPVMRRLLSNIEVDGGILLSRVYQEGVMCTHQEMSPGFDTAFSYERGRPMPLYVGATSKIILSNLPPRAVKRIYNNYQRGENGVDLGEWADFKNELRGFRRAGHCMTHGAVDKGIIGIAAPIFNDAKSILGSLSVIVRDSDVAGRDLERMAELIKHHAREIELVLSGQETAPQRAARIAVVGSAAKPDNLRSAGGAG